MAGGVRRLPPSLANTMSRLHGALAPGANKATGRAEPGRPLVIPASQPRQNNDASPLSKIGGKTLTVEGAQDVPTFSGKIDESLLQPLERALTPEWVRDFQRLTPPQKDIARTMLGVALDAMSPSNGSRDRIDPIYMRLAVKKALWLAQQPLTMPDRGVATPTTLRVRAHSETETARTPTTVPVAAHGQPSQSDPRNELAPTPLWTDRQIKEKLQALMKQRNPDAPQALELMTDLLINPAKQLNERVNAEGKPIGHSARTIRNIFGWPGGTELRAALAREIGMPPSAVVAKIRHEDDPELGKRVINSINPASRDRVAAALLEEPGGSKKEKYLLRTLDQIFHSGDPKITEGGLAKIYPDDGAFASFNHSINTLGKLVGPEPGRVKRDRLEILRAMGFTELQILRMSDVGKQLIKRFDPKLGRFSPAEQTRRNALNLPNTPEEAAARIWSARYGVADNTPLTYSDLIVLGLLSDEHRLGVHDMNNRLQRFDERLPAMHGQNCVNHLFQTTDKWLTQRIARGPTARHHTPAFRADSQKKLLQLYGLAATSIKGDRQSIPTEFRIGDSVSSSAPRDQASKATRSPGGTTAGNKVDWRELLPLLEQAEANRKQGTEPWH